MADPVVAIIPSGIKERIKQLTEELLNGFKKDTDGKPFEIADLSKKIHNHKRFNLIINLFNGVESLKLLDRFVIEHYFLEMINQFLNKQFLSDIELNKAIDSLAYELKSRIVQWNVMVPIDNLDIEADSLQIGNVNFTHFDKNRDLYIQKYNLKSDSSEHFISNFENKVCASIEVVGDFENFGSIALFEIETAINLLRLYSFLSMKIYGGHIKLGMHGQASVNLHLYVSVNREGKSWKHSTQQLRSKDTFILSKERLIILEKNFYLKEMGCIMCKDPKSRSEIENQILLAIRWIGLAINDEIECDKFLKSVIAMECLILKNNEQSKKRTMAKKCADLLGITPEEKVEIHLRINRFYKIRGDIVHSGLYKIESQMNDDIIQLVINCIFKKFCTIKSYHSET